MTDENWTADAPIGLHLRRVDRVDVLLILNAGSDRGFHLPHGSWTRRLRSESEDVGEADVIGRTITAPRQSVLVLTAA